MAGKKEMTEAKASTEVSQENNGSGRFFPCSKCHHPVLKIAKVPSFFIRNYNLCPNCQQKEQHAKSGLIAKGYGVEQFRHCGYIPNVNGMPENPNTSNVVKS